MSPAARVAAKAPRLRGATLQHLHEPQVREPYVRAVGVSDSCLPSDMMRYLAENNVPGEKVVSLLRGITREYKPDGTYHIELSSYQACQDLLYTVSRAPKRELPFGDRQPDFRETTQASHEQARFERGLIEPDFSGRTVRISGVPKEARMYAIFEKLENHRAKMAPAPVPSWYYGSYTQNLPMKVTKQMLTTLLPIPTYVWYLPDLQSKGEVFGRGSPDFVAFLVRLRDEEEAHRIARLWHLATPRWDWRTLEEKVLMWEEMDADKQTPLELHIAEADQYKTPRWQLSAEVVY